MPVREHLVYLLIGGVGGLLLGYLFSYTTAAESYWDAYTTAFSVLATVMLVGRRLENWLYWIVIDLAYAGLYYSRGALLFALLMVVYTLIAMYAYRKWRADTLQSSLI
jgi:nicotinamide mononucleotide transporter